jgi:hypothetical protein
MRAHLVALLALSVLCASVGDGACACVHVAAAARSRVGSCGAALAAPARAARQRSCAGAAALAAPPACWPRAPAPTEATVRARPPLWGKPAHAFRLYCDYSTSARARVCLAAFALASAAHCIWQACTAASWQCGGGRVTSAPRTRRFRCAGTPTPVGDARACCTPLPQAGSMAGGAQPRPGGPQRWHSAGGKLRCRATLLTAAARAGVAAGYSSCGAQLGPRWLRSQRTARAALRAALLLLAAAGAGSQSSPPPPPSPPSMTSYAVSSFLSGTPPGTQLAGFMTLASQVTLLQSGTTMAGNWLNQTGNSLLACAPYRQSASATAATW